MDTERQRISELLPIFILVLSVLIFFIKIPLSGKALFGSDFVFYFYPIKKFIREYLFNYGTLPFWNPYQFSGTPFITNIQASMFYPLGLIYYLSPPEPAYAYSTILHCMLGSVFMYAFMRTLSISRAGSFSSAIIFTFNGFFMGHLYAGHLTFVQSYIWIPAILLFLHRFIQSVSYRHAAITGLLLGIQILGGFPQIVFYTILGILAFGLFYEVKFIRNRNSENAVKLGFGLVSILCIGFALAAVQVLPTLEFAGLSTRSGGLDYAFATYDSLHPKELLAFLIPDIFGNVVDGTYWRTRNGWHFWETCGYVGILPLCLLFLVRGHGLIRSLRLFFLCLCILSVILALGRYNPLYPIIYKLPGFNNFRIPAQIIFLYVFGMAVISGITLSHLQKEDMVFTKGFVLLFLSIGILMLFLFVSLHYFHFHFFSYLFRNFAQGTLSHVNLNNLYHRISSGVDRSGLLFFACAFLFLVRKNKVINSRLFIILINCLLMLDLGFFGIQFIEPHEFITSQEKEQVITKLNHNPLQGRVVTINELFKSNDGVVYGFPSVSGYDPLILRRYAYYIQASQNLLRDDHTVNLSWFRDPEEKLMKMLNVRQVVQEGVVNPVVNSMKYATLVKKAVVKSHDEILGFMMEEGFDPNEMVVLETEFFPDISDSEGAQDIEGECHVLEYDNRNIRIKTSSNEPGYLVLSEIYYPGWIAEVDGKKTHVLCGNYLFRSVALDKGEHHVHFYFVSWPFRVGALVSLVTLIGSLLLILRKRG